MWIIPAIIAAVVLLAIYLTNGVQNPTPVIQPNAPGHVKSVPLANNPFWNHFSNALVRYTAYSDMLVYGCRCTDPNGC
jgi:hypothetical protein